MSSFHSIVPDIPKRYQLIYKIVSFFKKKELTPEEEDEKLRKNAEYTLNKLRELKTF